MVLQVFDDSESSGESQFFDPTTSGAGIPEKPELVSIFFEQKWISRLGNGSDRKMDFIFEISTLENPLWAT